jgi:hypothetical protein
MVKRSRRLFVVLLASVSCLLGVAQGRGAVFSADAVKAAFLFRFASYVIWPADAPATGPFVIGVVESEPVAAQLDRLLEGMNVRGRPAEVRRLSKPQELDGIHILYVGPGSLARTHALRAKAASLPILIVTDRVDGFDAGGIVNFLEAKDDVRFEISLGAADRARLSIDSALLSVAARVEGRPQVRLDCADCTGAAVAGQ